jgi:glycosyltransferase involved in cell wall biosynthesis
VAIERVDLEERIGDGNCQWTASDNGVTFSRSIVPGDSLVTGYRLTDTNRGDVTDISPIIENVQPIDEEDAEAGVVPRWRGDGGTTVAHARSESRVPLSVNAEDGSARTRDGIGTDAENTSNGEIESGSDTTTPPRIIVGIPAYDEAVGIGSTILAAGRYADEVVVVDDGSADNTVGIAEQAGATVIEHETNKGKGGAIRTLLKHARSVDFDVLVLIDGDGQHVPDNIPQVAGSVLSGDTDLAIGSRYLQKRENEETPRYRRFGQRTLDLLTLGSTSANLTDTQSGFRALSSEAVDALALRTNGFGIETEMIDVAIRAGLTIREEPIDVKYDGIDGQTYSPFRHGLTVVRFVLGLMRDRHPLVFFGIPGVVLIIAGVLYGLDAVYVYQITGQFYLAKVLVGSMATILGTVGVFTGLVLNSLSRLVPLELRESLDP